MLDNLKPTILSNYQLGLEFAQQQAKQLDIKVLLAFIFSHNIPSMKLFASFEYQQWGVLPNVAIMDGNHYSLTILGKHLD